MLNEIIASWGDQLADALDRARRPMAGLRTLPGVPQPISGEPLAARLEALARVWLDVLEGEPMAVVATLPEEAQAEAWPHVLALEQEIVRLLKRCTPDEVIRSGLLPSYWFPRLESYGPRRSATIGLFVDPHGERPPLPADHPARTILSEDDLYLHEDVPALVLGRQLRDETGCRFHRPFFSTAKARELTEAARNEQQRAAAATESRFVR